MSSVSWTDATSNYNDIIKPWAEARNYANDITGNFLNRQSDINDDNGGDYWSTVPTGINTARASLVSFINNISGADRGAIQDLAQSASLDASRSNGAIFGNIFTTPVNTVWEYMDDNTYYVTTRGITYGTFSATGGNNVSGGSIVRLYKDHGGYDIENCWCTSNADDGVITAECTSDAYTNQTTQGQERVMIELPAAGYDAIAVSGGLNLNLTLTVQGAEVPGILSNPGFDSFTGTAAVPTAITNWTASGSTISNLALDSTNIYRSNPNVTTSYALKFDATGSWGLKQAITNSLTTYQPYYASVRYSNDGGSWSSLALDLDENLYPVNFTPASGSIYAELSWNHNTRTLTLAIGTNSDSVVIASAANFYVDELLFTPMIRFNNLWYVATPGYHKTGTSKSWKIGDSGTLATTATDTDASCVQQYLWRVHDKYLPHAVSGSATWTSPTLSIT